jgi:hypothetical protein
VRRDSTPKGVKLFDDLDGHILPRKNNIALNGKNEALNGHVLVCQSTESKKCSTESKFKKES